LKKKVYNCLQKNVSVSSVETQKIHLGKEEKGGGKRADDHENTPPRTSRNTPFITSGSTQKSVKWGGA